MAKLLRVGFGQLVMLLFCSTLVLGQDIDRAAQAIEQYQEGDYAQAIDSFQDHLATHPQDGGAYYNLALTYHATGADSLALEAIVLAQKYLPPSEKLHFLKGEILMARGEYGLALTDLTRCLDLNFLSYRAFQNRGWCYYQEEDLNAALDDLNKAIALYDGSAEAFLYRAHTYKALGDTTACLADLDTALAIDPTLSKALLLRANTYFELHDHPSALKNYDLYLADQPNDAMAFSNRGLTKSYLNDHRGAAIDLTEAIEIAPDKGQYYFNRATEYFVLGKPKDALADLDVALDKMEASFDAYLLRGKLYYDAGMYEKALNDLQQAKKINPESRKAKDLHFKVRITLLFTKYWLYILVFLVLLSNGIRLFRRRKASN